MRRVQRLIFIVAMAVVILTGALSVYSPSPNRLPFASLVLQNVYAPPPAVPELTEVAGTDAVALRCGAVAGALRAVGAGR